MENKGKADKRILAKSGMECWSAHWPICLLVLTADLALNFQTKREAISGLCLWVKKHKTKQNETDSCLEVQMFVAMRSWHSFSHGCLWWLSIILKTCIMQFWGIFLNNFIRFLVLSFLCFIFVEFLLCSTSRLIIQIFYLCPVFHLVIILLYFLRDLVKFIIQSFFTFLDKWSIKGLFSTQLRL